MLSPWRKDKEKYVISDLLEKLNSAGLDVPEAKLIENFELINKLSQQVSELLNESNKISKKNFSIERKIEAEKAISEAIIKLIVAQSIFERFETVIEDVEHLQQDRNDIWRLFRKFEEIVNQFMNNKTFSIKKDGEFEVRSSSRPINLENLSSGEKHIIAILGRAALTNEDGSVFITDEPAYFGLSGQLFRYRPAI